MIQLKLLVNGATEGVSLNLPATPAEVSEACAWFDRLNIPPDQIRIIGVNSPVPNLGAHIAQATIHRSEDLNKLNALAEKLRLMDWKQETLFSGALDCETICSLDDVLNIADRLDEYILFRDVMSDADLGRYVAVSGHINGDPRFPEEALPYLDFAKIGVEYCTDHGGSYTSRGYVKRREPAMEQRESAVITITLANAGGREIQLHLPVEEWTLHQARERLAIDEFTEATIVDVTFHQAYLSDLVPLECIHVGEANDLAMCIEEMQQTDGELLKYLAVLSVEQPETMKGALQLAMDLDDYERIIEGTYEYGQSVLRRRGADQELLEMLEGYTDFEKLGEDAMIEDGVRQTEFGLLRRCSEPFPEETQGIQMGGM